MARGISQKKSPCTMRYPCVVRRPEFIHVVHRGGCPRARAWGRGKCHEKCRLPAPGYCVLIVESHRHTLTHDRYNFALELTWRDVDRGVVCVCTVCNDTFAKSQNKIFRSTSSGSHRAARHSTVQSSTLLDAAERHLAMVAASRLRNCPPPLLFRWHQRLSSMTLPTGTHGWSW